MRERIQKLIADYENKISICDKQIDRNLIDNSEARSRKDESLMDMYREERLVLNNKRSAYQQAKVDIDSLLDHYEE